MARTSNKTVEKTKNEEVDTKVTKKKFKPDRNQYVPVANNCPGVLFYKSPSTNQEWYWDRYNDVHEMEFHELQSMKSRYPTFFKDQWIRILDEEIFGYLNIERFYRDSITPEELEDFFDLDVDDMKEVLNKANNSIKLLIANIAREKIENEELDSSQKIQLIEKKLKITLVDETDEDESGE